MSADYYLNLAFFNYRNIIIYKEFTSVGALPVVAGAIRRVAVFCSAYCGRHPQAPKHFNGAFFVNYKFEEGLTALYYYQLYKTLNEDTQSYRQNNNIKTPTPNLF